MRWLEMVVQRFRAPSLMGRMFARFNVEESFADRHDGPKMLRAAAIRCMTCSEIKACESWLDQAEAPDAPPPYCLNGSLIARLRRESHSLH